MNLNTPKAHKSYIRRKRCLHECSRIIQNTMRAITTTLGRPMSDAELLEFSTIRAREIEASCWSPRLNLTDKEYQKKTEEKTQQLCEILIRQNNIPLFQAAGCINTENFYGSSFAPSNAVIVQNSNFSQCSGMNSNSNFQKNIQNSQSFYQQDHELSSHQIQPPPMFSQAPINNSSFNNLQNDFFQNNSQNSNNFNFGNNIMNSNNMNMNINANRKVNNTNLKISRKNSNIKDSGNATMQKNATRNEKNDFAVSDFNMEEQNGQTSFDNSPDIDFPDVSLNSRDKYYSAQSHMQESSKDAQNQFLESKKNFPSSSTFQTTENDKSKTGKNAKSPSNAPFMQQGSNPPFSQQNQQMMQMKQQQQQIMHMQQQQQQMMQFQQQQMMQIQQQKQQISQLQQQQQQQMLPIQMQPFASVQQKQQNSQGNQGFIQQNSGFQVSLSPSVQQQQMIQLNQQKHASNSSMMHIPMDFSNNQGFMQSDRTMIIGPQQEQQHQMPQLQLMQTSVSNSELNGMEVNQDDDDDDQLGWSDNKQYKQFQLFDS